MTRHQDRVQVPDEAVEAAFRCRDKRYDESKPDYIRPLLEAALPSIEAACRERFEGELLSDRPVAAVRDVLDPILTYGSKRTAAWRLVRVALNATRRESCERCEGSGKLQVECGPPGEEFVPTDCERCKGSGVELRQGCGEWVSDPCPACEGTGQARREDGDPDA